jgi:anti-sigma factor (TIGR02949 family)
MQCERVRELLSPYLDGELSAEERRQVAAHLEECRSCSAQLSDFRRVGQTLAEAGREPAPMALTARVRGNLARAAHAEPTPTAALIRKPPRAGAVSLRRGLLRQAAVIAAACVLSALATWLATSSLGERHRLEQDVLTAHVRSLLQDSPIQVASSDAHTVKPWFAGRIDFSPEVKDLASDGFPLVGGRLDYVGGRRVGAVVYKRRLHIVNVFMWPSASLGDVAPRLVTRNGYNLLAWARSGVDYWAVSDLNAGDLAQLQALF